MKKKQRKIAFVLVLCMVLSMFTGIPVHATEVVEEVELYYAWADMERDSDSEPSFSYPVLPDNPEYNSGSRVSMGQECTWSIATKQGEGDTASYEPVAKDTVFSVLRIEGETESPVEGAVEIVPYSYDGVNADIKNKDFTGFYTFRFLEAGEYIISVGNAKLYVSVMPLGYFSAPGVADKESNLVNATFERDSEQKSTFYFTYKPQLDENTTVSLVEESKENNAYPFTVWGEDATNQFITYEKVETYDSDLVSYAITVKDVAYEYFELEAHYTFKEIKFDGDGKPAVNEDGQTLYDEWEATCIVPVKELLQGVVFCDPEWGEDGPYVSDEAGYRKELSTVPKDKPIIYLGTMDEEGTVTALENPIVMDVEGKESYAGQIEQYIGKDDTPLDGMYTVTFNQTGTYRIGTSESYIIVRVEEPVAGFFGTSSMNIDSYYADEGFQYTDEDRVFYFIHKVNPYEGHEISIVSSEDGVPVLYEEKDGERNPVNDSSIASIEKIQGEDNSIKVYKITLGDAFEEGNLSVEINRQDYYYNEDGTKVVDNIWNEERGIYVRQKLEGFVATDNLWDENGYCGIKKGDECFSKQFGSTPNSGQMLWFGEYTNDTYKGVELFDVQNDITVKYEGKAAKVLYQEDYNPEEINEDTDVVISKWYNYESEKIHPDYVYECYFQRLGTYTIEYKGSVITFNVDTPPIGIYSNEDGTIESWLGKEIEYDRTTNGKTTYYIVPADKNLSYDVKVTDQQFPERTFLSIGDSLEQQTGTTSFTLTEEAKCDFTILIRSADGEEEWIRFGDVHQSDRGVVDGKKETGFSGTFMTEEEYKAECIDWADDTPLYWVHGDTIQEVIDGLMDAPETVEWNGKECSYKTPYICVNPAIPYDSGSSEEIQAAEDNAAKTQEFTTPSEIAGVMIKNGYENDYLPELQINVRSDFKIAGRFHEPDTDKANIYCTFVPESENVVRVNDKELTADNASEEIYVAEPRDEWTSAKVKVICSAINQEVNVDSEIKETIKEATIKNNQQEIAENIAALTESEDTELASMINTAINTGKDIALSLDMAAIPEEIPGDATDDVKTAIEKQKKEAEKIQTEIESSVATELVNVDVQYLNIDLTCQVKDSTTPTDKKKISEVKAPIEVSVKLGDSFISKKNENAKGRKFVVYRYHDKVVDKLEALFDEVTKMLTFKTDKFSTYAIVAEDIVPTGIALSKAPTKISYTEGEKFDKTGMKVVLVYSDGSKEEVADYTVDLKDALTTANKEVVITYKGYTAKQAITVNAKQTTSDKKPDPTPTTPVDPTTVGETTVVENATFKVVSTEEGKKAVTYVNGNKNATTVKIPETVTVNGNTYAVTEVADNAFSGNKKLTTVSIPDSVTKIGKNAFKNCVKLKSVTIPANVTEIGNDAFSGCKKMTKVTVGKNVTTIGDKAFYNCSALTKVTIPANVSKIGKQTFAGCKKLKTITIKSTKLTSKNVGSKAFKGIYAKATIKVPKSKLTSYKKLLKSKGVSSKAKIKK